MCEKREREREGVDLLNAIMSAIPCLNTSLANRAVGTLRVHLRLMPIPYTRPNSALAKAAWFSWISKAQFIGQEHENNLTWICAQPSFYFAQVCLSCSEMCSLQPFHWKWQDNLQLPPPPHLYWPTDLNNLMGHFSTHQKVLKMYPKLSTTYLLQEWINNFK